MNPSTPSEPFISNFPEISSVTHPEMSFTDLLDVTQSDRVGSGQQLSEAEMHTADLGLCS